MKPNTSFLYENFSEFNAIFFRLLQVIFKVRIFYKSLLSEIFNFI